MPDRYDSYFLSNAIPWPYPYRVVAWNPYGYGYASPAYPYNPYYPYYPYGSWASPLSYDYPYLNGVDYGSYPSDSSDSGTCRGVITPGVPRGECADPNKECRGGTDNRYHCVPK